jgi:hypothetical protein
MLLTLELATKRFVSFFEEEEHDRSVAISQMNDEEDEDKNDIDDEADENSHSKEDILTNENDSSAFCREYF